MLSSVFFKTLRDNRRSWLIWSISLGLLIGFFMAFYPAVAGEESFNELTENLPESLNALFGAQDIASPVGYLDSQFFGYLGPLLLLIFAVSRGADAIAGEEQRHTFDLLMANPISRTRVVLHKFAAISVLTLALGTVCFLVMWALTGPVDMDIGATELGAAMLGVSLLALLFAGIALAISCMVSNKALSAGVTAGLATISYFVSSLAPVVEGLSPLEKATPFYLYDGPNPLANGFSLSHNALFVAITVGLAAFGAWGLNRRDLVA
ncbi:MAG: ABC transporter permease subunit [Actinomycetota bacterium]